MDYSGQLFLIVGNSGSGKDSLLEEVMTRWPASAKPLKIPRRYITRPAHESEPFVPVTPQDFAGLRRQGKFCLNWYVYDTHYGVPATAIKWLKEGDLVIVNVSRAIIPQARQLVPGLKVIFISVPLASTLQRITSRNRESLNDRGFKQRLARAKANQTLTDADFVVDNSGSLKAAVDELLGYLLSFC